MRATSAGPGTNLVSSVATPNAHHATRPKAKAMLAAVERIQPVQDVASACAASQR